MKLMSEMRDCFKGRPAAILGGGPSLPGDMDKLPKGCVLIAVNYHALQLCQADFMVYNDDPPSDPLLEEAVASYHGVKVSPHVTSDIKLDTEVWIGFYSSNFATWFALWMGCNPVILCGMDCYQGEQKYFHPYEDKPHYHYPLDHHINPWVEDAKNMLPNSHLVKAMSGPLIKVFGAFEAKE